MTISSIGRPRGITRHVLLTLSAIVCPTAASSTTTKKFQFGQCVSGPTGDYFYRVALMTNPRTGKEDFVVQTYADKACEAQRYMWAEVCNREHMCVVGF